ncbi:MATE family efflux transporter [bacterium]|nr:MATE family efflux transporter [bacterium]
MLKTFKKKFFNRWNGEVGYRQILILSFPLILSTSSWSIQHFVDRVFLSRYSTDAIAASMPAGLLNHSLLSIFIGIGAFINTFVAQYYGAKQFKNIGAIVWQGIYISILGGIFNLLLIPLAPSLFRFIGHEHSVLINEISYFQILCIGAFPAIASSSFSSFFSGRKHLFPVMWINLIQTIINILLDYCMIFGKLGFPELGIKGAALATVISGYIAFFLYFLLFSAPKYRDIFSTLKNWKFNPCLFNRLVYYGLPSSLQFFIDSLALTIFIMFVGRLGKIALAATNIAFNISSLAFMPMIGIGITISILVGQNLGKNDPNTAEKSVYSGFHLTILYMATMSFLYIFKPHIFINPFIPYTTAGNYKEIYTMSVILLKFIAFFSIFDTMNIVFLSALRGAGDTHYIMKIMLISSILLLIIPSFIVINILNLGIFSAWIIITFFVTMLGLMFFIRFKKGYWKNIRVIETTLS